MIDWSVTICERYEIEKLINSYELFTIFFFRTQRDVEKNT